MEEKLRALPAELMTDMPHCIYPEGLYCALKTMSAIGHPLYVTENGVADADDTRRRWLGGIVDVSRASPFFLLLLAWCRYSMPAPA